VSAILFASACSAAGDMPVNTPTEPVPGTPSVTPSVTPQPTFTTSPTGTVLPPTLQALPFPVWVTDFSDPTLSVLSGRRPTLHDEFAGLNQGWFYFIPASRKGPFYAHMQDETLLIKLPAENENKDYWVYNPRLLRKNFVLSFDFQFEETEPADTVRFQFDQTTDQSVALDLSKNQTWALHWGDHNNWKTTTGTFDYLPPERITILIVMRDRECAVFLNDAPLTYSDTCRTGAFVRSVPWAVTFHMLAEPGHIAAVTIDNIKLWDLDKIIGLP